MSQKPISQINDWYKKSFAWLVAKFVMQRVHNVNFSFKNSILINDVHSMHFSYFRLFSIPSENVHLCQTPSTVYQCSGFDKQSARKIISWQAKSLCRNGKVIKIDTLQTVPRMLEEHRYSQKQLLHALCDIWFASGSTLLGIVFWFSLF